MFVVLFSPLHLGENSPPFFSWLVAPKAPAIPRPGAACCSQTRPAANRIPAVVRGAPGSAAEAVCRGSGGKRGSAAARGGAEVPFGAGWGRRGRSERCAEHASCLPRCAAAGARIPVAFLFLHVFLFSVSFIRQS